MRTRTSQQNNYIPFGDVKPLCPTISLAELNEKSITVDESERLLSQQIHDFYHNRA